MILRCGDNCGEGIPRPFIISSTTLEELEDIKSSNKKDETTKYKARRAVRFLDGLEPNKDYYVVIYTSLIFEEYLYNNNLPETPDNKICACAAYASTLYQDEISFVSDDICCRIIAQDIFGLKISTTYNKERTHHGYIQISMTDEELADFYQNMSVNKYSLEKNEYIIIKDIYNKTIDKYKWDGEYHKKVCDRTIKSTMFGTIKPLDDIQACAMDSIVSNEITVLTGRAGSGKTTLPLTYFMQQIEKGKISKLYVVYSYEPLRNARELGFEKGDHVTKLITSASIGNILSSKIGDIDQVEYMIERGTLDIIPTANIRGVEFESDSCVLVTEAQNLDVYTLKTIIQRCKAGCKQVYEGDVIEQRDTNIQTVGINRLIDVFKGDESFGYIKLKNNYRSRIGELADEL